jgi:endonuclease/exonuclease/phosphatase family metal-dependent hydrolase
MKIATWNINGGFVPVDGQDQADLAYYTSSLKSISPDMVCLQEVLISENRNQACEIADDLGMEHVAYFAIGKSHLTEHDQLAIAIISRHPITASSYRELPDPGVRFQFNGKPWTPHRKGFMQATLDIDGKLIRVLSGHMEPFHRSGNDFMDEKFKHIRGEVEDIIMEGDTPTLAGVDLNYENEHLLLPRIFKHGFSSILGAEPTRPKNRRTDKIIVSKDWSVIEHDIITSETDHYLCWAELSLK